jgi:nicotinamide riboside kinase
VSELLPLTVCVLGAESTGKTTLCEQLAAHYGVPFIPEFGRWYTEAMPDPARYKWSHEDFITIASVQNRFEDDAARWLRPVIVCDTNSFVTSVFERAYLAERAKGIDELWQGRRYALLLLTDPHTPFEQDTTTGLRSADARRWMHDRYLEYVRDNDAPWLLLTGSVEERTAASVAAIDALLGRPPA